MGSWRWLRFLYISVALRVLHRCNATAAAFGSLVASSVGGKRTTYLVNGAPSTFKPKLVVAEVSAANKLTLMLSLNLGERNVDNDYVAENELLSQDDTCFIPQVLYETDRILVIHKPSGISHHDQSHSNITRTISGILSLIRQFQRKQQQQPIDESFSYTGRLYGVHRLDQVTSGILLLAKDAEAAQRLTAAFRSYAKQYHLSEDSPRVPPIQKYYVALSAHNPKKKKQGWIRGVMARGRRKSWYLIPQNESTERSHFAVTRFFTAGLGHIFPQHIPRTLLLFRPYTGKTHQLRVAAKSIGLPLVGDPIYSSSQTGNTAQALPRRTYLHATALCWEGDGVLPGFSVFCPPPAGFVTDFLQEDDDSERNLAAKNTSMALFHRAFYDLIEKHCRVDCPTIADEARKTASRTHY
jgi:tRNA pseudouridine32 synthase / 23S rRNA pseudouridine746 synthase